MPRTLFLPVPISCDAVAAHLSAYLDGELPRALAASVAAHLAWCPACARFAGELALTVAALRRLSPSRRLTAGWLAGLGRGGVNASAPPPPDAAPSRKE